MVYETIGNSPVDWAGKSYPAIKDIAAQDDSILVVPVASLEQHGYHLPTATDTILVDAVSHLGAEQVSDEIPLLITPPVWSGYSPHHMSFGGTVTIAFEQALHVLEDITHAALTNGFDTLLLVNGHGGNRPLIATATQTIGNAHPDIEVLGLTYFELGQYFMDELRDSERGGIAHGGELETSMMLHLRPDLVDEDAIAVNYWDNPYGKYAASDLLGSGVLSANLDIGADSDSGTLGDPSLASAEKGEVMVEAYTEEMAELLRTIAAA